MTREQRQDLKVAVDQARRQIVSHRRWIMETHCENCHAELPPFDERGRQSRQRFCTPSCRKKWNDKNTRTRDYRRVKTETQ